MPADRAALIGAATRAGGLAAGDARALFAMLLDDELAASGAAALPAEWPDRRATPAELTGFVAALDGHTRKLERVGDAVRPVLLPSLHGTLRHANMTALAAFLLRRYEIPVVVHGLGADESVPLEGDVGATPGATRRNPVSTFDVFRELGTEPASTIEEAQTRLQRDWLVLVPLAVLAPGLARLVAREARPRRLALLCMLAKLIDPFCGDGYRVVGTGAADDRASMRAFLLASRSDALLLDGTEGEPFADPGGEAAIECISGGRSTPCAEPEDGIGRDEAELPAPADVPATAAWIADVLAGRRPPPPSLVTQLGCCLAGARGLGEAA